MNVRRNLPWCFAMVSLVVVQMAALQASPLSLERVPSGELSLSYLGVLQESDDLVTWSDVDPQPSSPFLLSPNEDSKWFRSKGVAGNGLLQMSEIFTDFMVLQRGQPVPIWGYLAPGAGVTVSFGGDTYQAIGDASGRWEVTLPAMDTAWAGRTMTIQTGWETKEIDEVVVGEVWFVSGGENMNLSLGELGTAAAQNEITNTFDDLLRVFRQDETANQFPQNVSTGDWYPAVTGYLSPIAAVPYYFGKRLRAEVGVPIGIIECARDAQPIETYLSDATLGTFTQGQNEIFAKFNAYADWENGGGGVDPALRPELAAQTFNGMIHPLAGYGVRGLLWYQGEIDATWNKSIFYREFLQGLAGELRSQFGAQLPFYYVQLANYNQPSATGGGVTWTTTQDEMRRALPTIGSVGQTGMVVANDLGDPTEINPVTGKDEIGERLADWALVNQYSKGPAVFSGPLYQSATISGSTIEVSFDYSSGLTTTDGQAPRTFDIREAGGGWVPADAAIVSNRIQVSASGITEPVAVRYAWSSNPTLANLTNSSGLPASVFSSEQGLEIPGIFSDGMILQREKGAKIWGWVCAGCGVTVQFGGQTWEAVADDRGRWEVILDNLAASAIGRDLVIVSEEETRTISDVLVGEVWLGTGQSNMEFPFAFIPSPANDLEVSTANDPLLRVFTVDEQARKDPLRTVTGDWLKAESGDMPEMPVVPYFYAKKLRAELGVPVAIIENAWGGQPIQGFITEEKLLSFPEGVGILGEKTAAYAVWDQAIADYEAELAAWNANPTGPMPEPPTGDPQFEANLGGQLYNGMVAPLVGYGLRGVVCYHGEANSFGFSSQDYREMFEALVEDWRARWEEDLPFYYTQLANFDHGGVRPGWVTVQDEQRRAFANLTNSGMAVANDIGDPNDVHPADKTQVADRLARWALLNEYGQTLVPSGPLYQSATIAGSTIEIDFSFAAGLSTRDALPVGEIEIKAQGGNWLPATASISGDKLIVSRTGMANPVAVRYAWDSNPTGANLVNGEGLPASLFTTE